MAVGGEAPAGCERTALAPKLWLYTNFDCNIRCTYCVTESAPTAPRRTLGLANFCRLLDEAVALGFRDVFVTGGEPFLLDEIYEMLDYASARVTTTVLTNAMLLRGKRWEQLCAIANDNLRVQVSLDGGRPQDHDVYRGPGTWAKTVEGIHQLLSHGFHVCIGTTETPANSAHIKVLHTFRRSLGIADQDHFVRPLARRGFSQEGMEVGTHNLVPEVTVSADGVYWHPLLSPSDTDMRVSAQIFPLSTAIETIRQQLSDQANAADETRAEFT